MNAVHTAVMSTSQAIAAWAVSFVLAVSIAAVFYTHAPTFEDRVFEGVNAPIVVIGSSLLLFGISPSSDGRDTALLGDGRAHTRLAITALRERESLDLLQKAIESGAETILLEANTFVVDIQHVHRAAQRGPWEVFKHRVPQFFRPIRAGARAIGGVGSEFDGRFVRDVKGIDTESTFDMGKLTTDYPLVLHPPRYPAEMATIVQDARRAGIEIMLVAPPRPQAAADILGPEVTGALEEQLIGLAANLDLPLFRPEAVWPNQFFVDHGHLNLRGRRRFMSELAAWSTQRP